MAEEKLNAELRVQQMLTTVVTTVNELCIPLPADWLESDFTAIQVSTTPTHWMPIYYRPTFKFFREPNFPDQFKSQGTTFKHYTIQGRTIFFGGQIDPVNGTGFRMDYYQRVPVFSDTVNSWIYTNYPSLYLYTALGHADLHAVGEEDKAMALKQLSEDMIEKLNNNWRRARASGSILSRGHTRSFG